MKPETLSFAVLAICAALVCSTNAADAQTGLPPLTAQWWQWVLSIPTDNNPTLDTTGEDCMVGQQGPIWFLTGANFGGETPPVTRSCSMPAIWRYPGLSSGVSEWWSDHAERRLMQKERAAGRTRPACADTRLGLDRENRKPPPSRS
jgi:hypothetical protein